jgi:hypothetical protein
MQLACAWLMMPYSLSAWMVQLQVVMALAHSLEMVKREKTLLLYAVISSVELMICGKVCRLARALTGGGMTRSVSVHDVCQ